MWKIIVILVVAMTAKRPTPSEAITLKVSDSTWEEGSIVRSSSIPDDSVIFGDEEEELASIATANRFDYICSLSFTSLAQKSLEKPYESGWLCYSYDSATSETQS